LFDKELLEAIKDLNKIRKEYFADWKDEKWDGEGIFSHTIDLLLTIQKGQQSLALKNSGRKKEKTIIQESDPEQFLERLNEILSEYHEAQAEIKREIKAERHEQNCLDIERQLSKSQKPRL
jgi:hypothetical protein